MHPFFTGSRATPDLSLVRDSLCRMPCLGTPFFLRGRTASSLSDKLSHGTVRQEQVETELSTGLLATGYRSDIYSCSRSQLPLLKIHNEHAVGLPWVRCRYRRAHETISNVRKRGGCSWRGCILSQRAKLAILKSSRRDQFL